MDVNSRKTDKNEHENGKCQKPKPGKSNGQKKSSKVLKSSLEIQILSEIVLGAKFEELAISVPQVSESVRYGPLKISLKKGQSQPAKN